MQINIALCGLVRSRCNAYRATKKNSPEKPDPAPTGTNATPSATAV